MRQGDTNSPELFTAGFEITIRKMNWEGMGVDINGEYLNYDLLKIFY